MFDEKCLDEEVRHENADGGRDKGDDDAVEHPVQVAGGDVDHDVPPGEGQRHQNVQPDQDQEDQRVRLALDPS